MRALSTTLLAEQRLPSKTPYVRVALTKSGESSYTFATDDATNRILSIWQREAPVVAGDDAADLFRGLPSIMGIPISTIIRIRDENNTYSAIDLRGYRVVVGWGLIVSGSPERSDAPDVKVISQKNISVEGELIVELYCMDKFAEIELRRVIAGYIQLNGTPSGAFDADETVTGDDSGATGVFDSQAGSYIRLHTVKGAFDIGEQVSGLSETLTITSIEVAGSVGAPPKYNRDVTTLQILGALLSGIAELKDDTDSALVTTLYLDYSPLILDILSNDTLGSVIRKVLGMTLCGMRPRWDSGDSETYMRLLYMNSSKQAKLNGTPSGAFTAGETVTQATSGATGRFVYQNSDSIIIEAQTGTFNTTNLVTGGSSSETITPSSIEAYDYEYNAVHAHYSCLEGVSVVVPNRIIYVDKFPTTSTGATYTGSAEDTESKNDIGYVTAMFSDSTIQSDGEADNRAAAKLTHVQMESYQGIVVVPMNCGQEILDYIKVTDSRASNVVEGWVGELIRKYNPEAAAIEDRYTIELTIGYVKPDPEVVEGTPTIDNVWDTLTALFDGEIETPGTGNLIPETMVLYRNIGNYFYDIFAIAIDGYLYVGGGDLGEPYTKAFHRYDIAAGTWSAMADLPDYYQTIRHNAASGYNNGKIYFVCTHLETPDNGGWDVSWFKVILEYDIAGNSWTDLGSYPALGSLDDFVIACCSDALYLHQSNSSGTARFDKMDYSTHNWTSLTSLGERAQLGGNIGDEVYIVVRTSPYETFLYDKGGDSWADQSQNAPSGRWGGCFVQDTDELWTIESYLAGEVNVYKYTVANGWVNQFSYGRDSYGWDWMLQPTGVSGFYAIWGVYGSGGTSEAVARGAIHFYDAGTNVWSLASGAFVVGDILQVECDEGIPVKTEKGGAIYATGSTMHLVTSNGTYFFTLSKDYSYASVKIHKLSQ